MHTDYPGKPSFLGCLPRKMWSTEAAAKAAIDHFRAWVDGGRRKQTAAAIAARQPPAFDDSALPERYSERRAKRTKIDASVSVCWRAGEVLVGLALATATVTLTPAAYMPWRGMRARVSCIVSCRGASELAVTSVTWRNW